MSAVLPAPAAVRFHLSGFLTKFFLLLAGLGLAVFLLAPMGAIFIRAVEDNHGNYVGFVHFVNYFSSPALARSVWNSVWVALAVAAITVPAAFLFAYALTRSCMPLKSVFRTIALTPLLAPSLLAAISFIYWFGNQGVLKGLMVASIYGAPGIILSEMFAVFPHALMILITALSLADARLYEAADALGTSAARKFFTITLPGAKYGLISAALVTFTLVITDFGIPKVIGGNFDVLATDIFKLVIGQQDFQRGAVVAVLLLAPALLTFAVDRFVQRKQTSMLTARAVPYAPKPSRGFDLAMTAYCVLVTALLLAVLGMAVFASFVKFWPYDLSFSLRHYAFGLVDAEVDTAFFNSLRLAFCTAVGGTVLVFVTSYLLEKTRGVDWLRPGVQLLALLPMA
ncbi:MAG: ABC transporter permease subunit, partial [Panacagrimonas sp.]